jgi:hypothetical protein
LGPPRDAAPVPPAVVIALERRLPEFKATRRYLLFPAAARGRTLSPWHDWA